MSLTNDLEVVPFKALSSLFTSSKPRISVLIPKDLSISPSVVWGLAIKLAKSILGLLFLVVLLLTQIGNKLEHQQRDT